MIVERLYKFNNHLPCNALYVLIKSQRITTDLVELKKKNSNNNKEKSVKESDFWIQNIP